jgi:hypothetical protein
MVTAPTQAARPIAVAPTSAPCASAESTASSGCWRAISRSVTRGMLDARRTIGRNAPSWKVAMGRLAQSATASSNAITTSSVRLPVAACAPAT